MIFFDSVPNPFQPTPQAPEIKPAAFGFYAIYLASFLFTFHYALPLYINSSFIEGIAGKGLVGILFAIGSLIGLGILIKMPPILRRFGNRRTVIFCMGVEFFALLGLATFSSPLVLIPAFVITQAFVPVIIFNLDLFLESFSKDGNTGAIRGAYLTLLNLAILTGPFLAAFVLTNSDFWKVFLLAGIFILPAIFLVFFSLKTFHDPHYVDVSYVEAFQRLKDEPNIRNGLLIQFLLRFFYIWYTIYIPIYLATEMGFSFGKILGVIVPFTMVPFLLLQYPLGKLADKRGIERELLMIGFIILAVATALISFVDSTNLFLWAGILFLGRVGAAIIEVMSATYFYKQIAARHVNLISMFRTLRPASSILAPILATILLTLLNVPYQYLFLILGLILLSGFPLARSLERTQ